MYMYELDDRWEDPYSDKTCREETKMLKHFMDDLLYKRQKEEVKTQKKAEPTPSKNELYYLLIA